MDDLHKWPQRSLLHFAIASRTAPTAKQSSARLVPHLVFAKRGSDWRSVMAEAGASVRRCKRTWAAGCC